MEITNFNPRSAPKITSFLHSFMAGCCFADEKGIEFCDYRDETLRYRLLFDKANFLINYCEQHPENPLPSFLASSMDTQSLENNKTLACQILSNLNLHQIKLIQIFLFNDYLTNAERKPASIDYKALKAVRFGHATRFNDMMSQKALTPTKNIMEVIQELIHKIENEI